MIQENKGLLDTEILYGPKICGKKVREILKGKYEVRTKKEEHVKVIQDDCTGCELCYIVCPTGSFEMENGKSEWKYGMEVCSDCGVCRYICPVDAIEWSYPEGGAGAVMKYS
ncbi:MAG: 4Fe-4S binding protein [Dehalococcoidia bacterium]